MIPETPSRNAGRAAKAAIAAALLSAAAAAQQPPLTVDPVVNAPCEDGPKMAGGKPETVGTPLDSGFVSLFNGVDLKGWWENCNAHTSDKAKAGIWIVDPSSHILYSMQENGNGGLLMTNESFDNYELVMDLWPTFGNDAGIFNRSTRNGVCWQTGLDYIKGSGVGGSYNEAGWLPGATINDDPVRFNDTPENPAVTTWTDFTKSFAPASFGCSPGGCVSADWDKVWDANGWNQIRVKFYDGLTAGREVHMKTWLRKAGSPTWVPIYDAKQARTTPAAPLALQMHAGDKWKAGAGNLYRNIKIHKLDMNGEPLPPTPLGPDGRALHAPPLRLEGEYIAGYLDGDWTVELRDIHGRSLETFRAEGTLRRPLPPGAEGILLVKFANARGETASLRLTRF